MTTVLPFPQPDPEAALSERLAAARAHLAEICAMKKLTPDIILTIREEYGHGTWSYFDLATKYKLSRNDVRNIIRNKPNNRTHDPNYIRPVSKLDAGRPPGTSKNMKTNTRRGLGKITSSERREKRERIYVRDNGICQICGQPVSRDDATIDHKTPVSLGGKNADENLRLAHRRCNLDRGNRTCSP